MVSKKRDGPTLVRNWIFEHACKHRMERIVQVLLKYQHRSLYLKCTECEDIGKTPQYPCINPRYMVHYLLCDLLEKFQLLLKSPLTKEILSALNIDILEKCQENLEVIYPQKKVISFSNFSKLQCALKTLSLVLRVVRKDIESVSSHLKILYPSHAENVEKYVKQFGITEQEAKEHVELEKQNRIFICQLLFSEEKREAYIQTRLLKEVVDFLQECTNTLPCIINEAIKPELPETYIEKIMTGEAANSNNDIDPAVQVLLDFLQSPKAEEDDLICVLKLLDPGIPVTKSPKKEVILNLEADHRNLETDDQNLISSTQDDSAVHQVGKESGCASNNEECGSSLPSASDKTSSPVPSTSKAYTDLFQASTNCKVLLDICATGNQMVVSSSDISEIPPQKKRRISLSSSGTKKYKTSYSAQVSCTPKAKVTSNDKKLPKQKRASSQKSKPDLPSIPLALARKCRVKLNFQKDQLINGGKYAIYR